MSKRKNNGEIVTNYSTDKIEYLKKAYPDSSVPMEQIEKILGVSQNAIRSLAFRFGLKRRNSWTQKEDEYLKDIYENTQISLKEISKKLNGRSVDIISGRIYRLGLHRSSRQFTQAEIDFILNAKDLDIKDIANRLGVKIYDIKHFLAKNNQESKTGKFKKCRWTDGDDAYLKINYTNPEISFQQISNELNRSLSSVMTRAGILGLKRERINLWTREEDEYLKANYENKDVPMSDIFAHLSHRPQQQVYIRCMALGLKRTSFKLMPNDIDLIMNQKEWRIKDIAAHLGISISTVNYYLAKNNIKRNNGGKKATWTNEQNEYMRTHYHNESIPMEVIAKYLRKSQEAVYYHAKILNLSRNRSK